MAELKPIQEEAFARYQETHEGHLGYSGRSEWAHDIFVRCFLPHLPRKGHHVLEIACGQGDMLRVFREKGYVCVGTDLDPQNVSRTEHVYARDVFKHPLETVKFNVIVMMGIIEHIRKDELLPSLRAVRSMLAPGGVVLITTQNMDSPMGDHYRYLDITHELGFTRESLCQVGRLAGFTDVQAVPMYDPPPPRGNWKGRLEERLRRVWKAVYRYHIKMVGGPLQSTWWDAVGLMGVWRA